MSRTYKLEVEAIGISDEQLIKVVGEKFGWDGEAYTFNETTFFCGGGCLYGEQSEEEAHEQIYKALNEINPKAKIKTEWTYMENLPLKSYGDTIEYNGESIC